MTSSDNAAGSHDDRVEVCDPGRGAAAGAALFLREFVRAPGRIGAMAPSSRRLAEAIVAPIPHSGHPVVVELGPGTGAFTGMIQERLAGRGRHLAIELNQRFAHLLAARHPAVEVITGDATGARALLSERGIPGADVVVSGLPWLAFPDTTKHAGLDAVASILNANGVFTTFGYGFTRPTPCARRFRRLLQQRFEEVIIGRTVVANLPPAFAYYIRRPRTRSRPNTCTADPEAGTSAGGAS
jgi:phosphatidylethanolamine/phosphatidyl-N-methylethanolamine N-methyltransferase